MIEKRYTNYVLDADIKSFFNHLDHDWILKSICSDCIRHFTRRTVM